MFEEHWILLSDVTMIDYTAIVHYTMQCQILIILQQLTRKTTT